MANPRIPDQTGQRFGALIALQMVAKPGQRSAYLWQCDCGNTVTRPLGDVKTTIKGGSVPSCGCRRIAAWKTNGTALGSRIKTHGLSKTRLYGVHRQMMQRCSNPAHRDYPGWGGRGIAVCAEWRDFIVFREWALSSGYAEGLTIERGDNDGNYCPQNCAWIPNELQAKNRRPRAR